MKWALLGYPPSPAQVRIVREIVPSGGWGARSEQQYEVEIENKPGQFWSVYARLVFDISGAGAFTPRMAAGLHIDSLFAVVSHPAESDGDGHLF